MGSKMYVNLILGSVDLEKQEDLERVLQTRSGWKELVDSGKVSKESALAVVKLSLENRFAYEWSESIDREKGGVVSLRVYRVKPQGDVAVPWLERRDWIDTVEYFIVPNTIEPMCDFPEALEDFLREGMQHDAGGRAEYLREYFDIATTDARRKEMDRQDAKKERLYFRALRQISVRG